MAHLFYRELDDGNGEWVDRAGWYTCEIVESLRLGTYKVHWLEFPTHQVEDRRPRDLLDEGVVDEGAALVTEDAYHYTLEQHMKQYVISMKRIQHLQLECNRMHCQAMALAAVFILRTNISEKLKLITGVGECPAFLVGLITVGLVQVNQSRCQ